MIIIPEMPKIPLEYEMNPEIKKAVHSLENKLKGIGAVRVFDGKVNVLGYQRPKSAFKPPMHYDIITNIGGEVIEENKFLLAEDRISNLFGFRTKNLSILERERKTREYKDKIIEIERQNMEDIKKAVSSIRIFHVSKKKVEEVLERSLKLAETGCSKAYIEAQDAFWLTVEAYKIGADYVIDVQDVQSDLLRGIPVKYADK